MAGVTPLSYSAAASSSNSKPSGPATSTLPKGEPQPHQTPSAPSSTPTPPPPPQQPRKRSPSPRHQPKTVPSHEPVYILTLQTDKPHHDRMTAWRKQYFPAQLNKLEAHLTLFHALPASKFPSSILPALRAIAASTPPFPICARKPFRLRRGIALSIPRNEGAAKIQGVHRALLGQWRGEGWLSEQDSGGMRAHYTIMNKADDEGQVLIAFEEVSRAFRPDEGRAEGLGLWRYERGFWRWEEGFAFTGTE
ncbi:hypothetical protein LTR62_003211 [Meristemomyces frigidus]|uniref:Uncharacterized protein n=1 Tax=Meristemomyces frigidus TaxID=1508187 RepID=A0AAN7TKE7_9PEZI|nr:hypothetical protein LTR62_003211 [Meristemomyces frigidus]